MHRRAALPLIALLAGCFPFGNGGDDDDDDPLPDAGATGTLDDVWQRSRTEIQVIDTSSGAMGSRTVAGPTEITAPEGGATYETFVAIEGDTLVTFAWERGAPVHHRLTQPFTTSADGVFMLMTGEGTRTFSMDQGHLTESGTQQLGDKALLVQATYGAVKGDFPPAGWPAEVLENELPQEAL